MSSDFKHCKLFVNICLQVAARHCSHTFFIESNLHLFSALLIQYEGRLETLETVCQSLKSANQLWSHAFFAPTHRLIIIIAAEWVSNREPCYPLWYLLWYPNTTVHLVLQGSSEHVSTPHKHKNRSSHTPCQHEDLIFSVSQYLKYSKNTYP